MNIKFFYKFLFSSLFIVIFDVNCNFVFGNTFSEKKAFTILFGNYNDTHKTALWKNIEFPKKEKLDTFWENKTGIVSSILFQSYVENGKEKFFFLTKTIPKDIPFECHACLPLLSATVFSLEKNDWKIESQNSFLMYEGEYASSPSAKLISVGKDKKGVLLEFDHHGDEHIKVSYLIIPYNTNIINAHNEITYYDNFNVCGRSVQCASFTAKIDFNKTKLSDYYKIKIRKFGTETVEKNAYKAISVNEERSYYFVNGTYKKISRVR